MKRLSIIGSSGSVGKQALEVVRKNRDKFCVHSLCVRRDIDTLIEQVREFRPKIVGVVDIDEAKKLSKDLPKDVELVAGHDALTFCGQSEADLVCDFVVGLSGLYPLVSAIEGGKDIALSNKESIVCAGEVIIRMAKDKGVKILPVDSEHSAIWQCLRVGNINEVNKIILTASGGAYYNWDVEELDKITPDMAIKHPNWKMGKKISVDSATMMNKALELIEARWLFDVKNVDYVVHPQSIIHSMVEFNDGSTIAQLANPNMELPIAAAIAYPDRVENVLPPFAFDKSLTFLPKREDVFIAPALAKRCIDGGGILSTVLDAVNEGAVKLFMEGKIKFTDIAKIADKYLFMSDMIKNPTLNDIICAHDYYFKKVISE